MRRTCLCGHPSKVHRHFHDKTYCGQCGCPAYASEYRAVVAANWRLLTRRSTPEQELAYSEARRKARQLTPQNWPARYPPYCPGNSGGHTCACTPPGG